MTKYIAAFYDHIITRNSARTYTHAWIVTNIATGRVFESGFAGSADKAAVAANASLPRDISPRDKKNAAIARGHIRTAREDGYTDVYAFYAFITKRTADLRAELKTEVVAVTTV